VLGSGSRAGARAAAGRPGAARRQTPPRAEFAPLPPPNRPPPSCAPSAAGRNFVRAALLGLMATFAGVLLFSAPEYLSQWAKLTMPDVLMQPGVQVGRGARARGRRCCGGASGAAGPRPWACSIPRAGQLVLMAGRGCWRRCLFAWRSLWAWGLAVGGTQVPAPVRVGLGCHSRCIHRRLPQSMCVSCKHCTRLPDWQLFLTLRLCSPLPPPATQPPGVPQGHRCRAEQLDHDLFLLLMI
jgi:hypothetical protein